MRKQLFSLFLALVLVLALMPVPARASGNAAVRIDNLTAAPGGSITVPIRCEGFENLAALELELYYDPAVLQFQSESMGWMLDGAVYTVHNSNEGRISMSAAAPSGISGEGELLYLYFSVASDCPIGKYPLHLAVGEAYDTALSPVAVTARSGSVQVAESKPVNGEFRLDMALSKDTLISGETLTATVCNTWNYVFSGMDLKFFYDPAVFELVNASVSENMGEALCSLHTATEGLVRLSCASANQIWCNELLSIELRVRDSATGTSLLTAEAADVYDENRIPYQHGSAQTQVTVRQAQETVVPSLRLESQPLVIGSETEATLILSEGSGLAAADFRMEYDADILECISVESAVQDGYLVINPNYADGIIRFSYVKESGTIEETPLVTIRWKPKSGADRHFTVQTTLIDPVDKNHGRVEISCPAHSSCVYRSVTSTATCTQPGGTVLTCVSCGSRINMDTTPALGHNYGEPSFQWTEDHVRCSASRTCSRDKSHIWQVECDVTHVSMGESCTGPGSITYTATADFYGEVYTDQVTVHLDSLGHDYAWTVITNPGCTTEGLRHGDCIRCDAVTEEVLTPLGHDHRAVVTPPTCTEPGFTTHTCTRCGSSYTDADTAELGHLWDGTTCVRCGEIRENPFTDVPESEYYFKPVLWAVANGITDGVDVDKFAPNATCTRGQIVTFLWRANGEPRPTTTGNPFSDVKKSDYFYNPVLWAVENGITDGYDVGKFAPDVKCTRGQVVTFLWRTAGEPKPTTSVNPFNDVTASDYFYNAVLWAVENGITDGYDVGKFAPNVTCTRGQVVTFLYRDMQKT